MPLRIGEGLIGGGLLFDATNARIGFSYVTLLLISW